MKKKVNVAVIGAGGIANNVHLPSLAQIEDANVAAICDLHEEKAKKAAEKFGIPSVYTSMYEMFEKEELDGVFVLVEPDRLYRAANDCLSAGLHVIMEKPAGITSYQANSLVRKAEETGKMCAVAMNRRHVPLVQFVFEKMKELTPITQVDGVFYKNSNIASSWHYASAFVCDIVHATDLVRYFAQSEPVKASTIVGRFNSPVDNAWSSIIQFENGVIGTLRANYQCGGRFHNFAIHGPKASAFINLGFGGSQCDARILHSSGKPIYSLAAAGVSGPKEEYIDGIELANNKSFFAYYGYLQEDIDFIEAIKNNRKPLCSIEDAAKTMEMVELLLASAI
ncbi:MAG: Gfo/Idh/MocA family protein [Caldicoprobacterales bacterium]|nr:Gfo/Idh/MocA family oxidoreductase [Clostridiales bacterium]